MLLKSAIGFFCSVNRQRMSESSLTVAIVALVEGAPLAACVAAVRSQAEKIIVVGRDGILRTADGAELGRCPTTDVPARRRRAAELADTALIGFVEDTVVTGPDWVQAACTSLSRHGVVGVGGPVSIDPALSPSTRALALTEFGRFQTRNQTGDERSSLPGCNFAFVRERLLAALPTAGLIDNEVFDSLLEKGGKLVWAPDMAVTYCASHDAGARLSTRFNHGRLYAGRKLSSAPWYGRLIAATKALALPPVMIARSLRQARGSGLRSSTMLGQIVLQHSAWAAGELAGALFGPPPRGLASWQ